MNVLTIRSKTHKFYFVELDCLIRVINRGNKVIVRATRNSFSERDKAFFIRHLAAEGFIPDEYQRYHEHKSNKELRLRWFVDEAWISADSALRCQAQRQLLCAIGVGAMIWLIAMFPVFLRLSE